MKQTEQKQYDQMVLEVATFLDRATSRTKVMLINQTVPDGNFEMFEMPDLAEFDPSEAGLKAVGILNLLVGTETATVEISFPWGLCPIPIERAKNLIGLLFAASISASFENTLADFLMVKLGMDPATCVRVMIDFREFCSMVAAHQGDQYDR